MYKKIFSIAILLIVISSTVAADGMICYRNELGDCTPYRQARQSAIINQENGYENLLIFINSQQTTNTDKFVWIFPVPAAPNQIEIANLKSFPSFGGTELKQQFKNNVNYLAMANFVALFPPAALLFFIGGPVYYSVANDYKMASQAGAIDRGYEIWQHIDKYGISTEVMTAWDTEKFYHYLEVRGTNLQPEAKRLIEEYINKPNYSFVISWISNPAEYKQANANNNYYYNQEPIGVFARFPTEKIYYPMRLTSVYNEQYLPVTINLVGFVEPAIFSNISKETKIGYYSSDRLQYGLNEEESANKIFNGKIPTSIKYTKISISAQAKYFTQDIEFTKNPSISAILLDVINAIWLPIAIIIFFLLTFAAIAIVNKFFLQGVLSNKKIALLSLGNFLTFFGYITAVFIIKETLKEKEKTKFKRLFAITAFWPIYFAIAIVFGLLAIALNILIV